MPRFSPKRLVEDVRIGWSALPLDLSASFMALAAFVTFALMGVLVRIAAVSIPIVEIVFLRQLLATLIMAPLFWRQRKAILHPQGVGFHIVRGVSAVGGMMCGLTAIVYLPFADATAIQMAEVFIITALAALVLKEQVGWRRWTATAVGFCGVLIMLQPFGGTGMNVYGLIALFGAFCGAVTAVAVRLGAKHDTTETVIFYQNIIILIIVAPFAAYVWVTPSWHDLGVIVVMALVLVCGLLLMTTALRHGRAAALAPLHYVRLLLMAVVGYAMYGEIPTIATVAGATLIMLATTYTLIRNASKSPATPPPPHAPP
jgi:drug/metabolite transporter (DMT)-like permease